MCTHGVNMVCVENCWANKPTKPEKWIFLPTSSMSVSPSPIVTLINNNQFLRCFHRFLPHQKSLRRVLEFYCFHFPKNKTLVEEIFLWKMRFSAHSQLFVPGRRMRSLLMRPSYLSILCMNTKSPWTKDLAYIQPFNWVVIYMHTSHLSIVSNQLPPHLPRAMPAANKNNSTHKQRINISGQIENGFFSLERTFRPEYKCIM